MGQDQSSPPPYQYHKPLETATPSADHQLPPRKQVTSMSKDVELCDTFSADSTVDGRNTPTFTNVDDVIFNSPTPSVPYTGAAFIIRHRDTGKTVTLVDGELQLCDSPHPMGGYHWQCIDKDGWLAFRNTVSGTYIGHNDRKKMIATANRLQSWERLCARAHPTGGFELLTPHEAGLWRVLVSGDGRSLTEDKKEKVGAIWEFLKI